MNFIAYRSSLSQGGIENTCYLLAQEFARRLGNDFVLYADNESIFPHNTNYVNCGEKRGWAYFLNLYKFVFRERTPNVNFCIHWMCGITALLMKKLKHIPYTVMVHGNEIMESNHKNIKVTLRDNILRRLILNNASIIFANSKFSKDLCSKICKNNNIVVVHPPVKYVDYPIINCKRYVLFSIGRHVERKGFQNVIKALPKICKFYPTIVYRLAGDGPYHDELVRCAAEEGVANNVVFLGKISEEKKHEELSNCDVFIMTSHEDKSASQVEGFGVCYLEASMHGKWIIARNSGGVSDAVLKNITGTLLKDSDPNSICKSIINFYENNSKIYIEKSISWAREHDVRIIVNDYLKYMEKV